MWITLTGFMASGKTKVARLLGTATNRPVVTLDDLAVRNSGCSLVDFFAEHGESGFRALELELLQGLDANSDLVLDGGGGLVEGQTSMEIIRSRGVVIWLDASWDSILGRLSSASKEDRPLVSSLGFDGLEALYHRRLPLYAQAADFRLRSDGGIPDSVAEQARLRWRMWQGVNREQVACGS